MAANRYAPLNLAPYWAEITDHLVQLVDIIPAAEINWSPAPGEWNFRGIYLHILGNRRFWSTVVSGVSDTTDLVAAVQTADGIKQELRRSWERLSVLLGDRARLDAHYTLPAGDDSYAAYESGPFDGHRIAYVVLVHDVHHRSDILRNLGLLGVELPASARRRPLNAEERPRGPLSRHSAPLGIS